MASCACIVALPFLALVMLINTVLHVSAGKYAVQPHSSLLMVCRPEHRGRQQQPLLLLLRVQAVGTVEAG